MHKEAKNLIKKTAKIAGVTCIAAGAVALMTTGAALKALTEGAKYLKNTVQKIIEESAEDPKVAETIASEEESVADEIVAEESAAIKNPDAL